MTAEAVYDPAAPPTDPARANVRAYDPTAEPFNDPTRVNIRWSGEGEMTFVAGGGDSKREIRIPPGWANIPSGFFDQITGGLNSDGKARGGSAAVYYNTPVRRSDGSARPLLQLGTPLEGDPVYIVDDIKGLRPHYRTRKRQEREARVADAEARIAELSAELRSIKAAPEAQVAPAIDPAGFTVDELEQNLVGLTEPQLEALIVAEVMGKNRRTAVAVIRDRITRLRAEPEVEPAVAEAEAVAEVEPEPEPEPEPEVEADEVEDLLDSDAVRTSESAVADADADADSEETTE